VLTWMLSPRYHLSDDSMLYVRAASGYRPGGPNFALPGVPPTVKSDTLVNYEAGWKTLFLDQRASIDLAVYNILWHGIQVSTATPNGSITYLTNGGTANSRGVELSTAFMPIRDLRLGFNAAYTDARLTEDAPGLNGKNGDQLPGIPRWNWSFTTDYYFRLPAELSGHVGGGYRWIGSRMSQVSSSPYAYPEHSYGVLDLNADVSRDIWTLRFYVKNLTNERANLNITYMQNGVTNAVVDLQSAILQPRTVGVEFDVQF
jgi:iron complex outermembrane receptor protein